MQFRCSEEEEEEALDHLQAEHEEEDLEYDSLYHVSCDLHSSNDAHLVIDAHQIFAVSDAAARWRRLQQMQVVIHRNLHNNFSSFGLLLICSLLFLLLLWLFLTLC